MTEGFDRLDFDETEFMSLLCEEQKRFVEQKSYPKFYRKNAIIHSPGDRVYHVNYILSGKIKISNLSASGKEVIYRFCGKNTFFGLAEICGEDRREVFAEATEDRALQSLAIQDTHSRRACLFLKLVEMSGKAGGGTLINDKLTHQELASMIGATRTTVTEIVNEYKDLRYIEYLDGKINILDFEKLREFAAH